MNIIPNNYTTEVINAAENLILADRALHDFTPKNFKKLCIKFKIAKTNFRETSNYLFAMRETDDESLVRQAIDIYRTRN
jgi:hypothetical protein